MGSRPVEKCILCNKKLSGPHRNRRKIDYCRSCYQIMKGMGGIPEHEVSRLRRVSYA